MKRTPNVMNPPGEQTAFSSWLERAVTDAPAFREKGLTLLRGILPAELTDRELPPRTEAQWGQPMISYVLLQGDTPLAALMPKQIDPEGDEARLFRQGAMFSREEPALTVPGLLHLTCPVETGECPQDEGPMRTMLARLLTMPQSGDELPACPLTKLPRGLEGELLKLDLLREVWTQDSELRLVPTPFGRDCGLVTAWSWNGDEVSQTVMCHPRSIPFLEGLAAEWLGEKPGHARRGPKPLARRMERARDGRYRSPSQNEDWFLGCQQLRLDEVVGERAVETLRQELKLSPDITWGEAGAALYRRQANEGWTWPPEQTEKRLELLCPEVQSERRVSSW